jgi:uncharacterized damage-inducible protein DinB
MSQTIINTAKTVRQMVIRQIESIPEEAFDVQPKPFNNTIRWNTGHIITALNGMLSLGITFNSNLPDTYAGLFKTGTKPSEWIIAPPSKAELVQILSQQLNSISEVNPGILEDSLQSPIQMGPLKFETVGELFNFAVVHETMHSTAISYLLKVIQHQDL